MARPSMIGYQPGDSFLHGLDVRHKLAAMAIITLSSVYASAWGLLMWSAVLILACRSVDMQARQAIKEWRWIWVLLVGVWVARTLSTDGTAVFNVAGVYVTREGLIAGTLICWRLINIIMLGWLLTATTRIRQITSAVEWLLRPIPGIPAKRIGTMLGLVVRFVPEILVQAHEVSAAQQARLIQLRKNPIYRLRHMSLPLLRRTFETADELALAMEARCYSDHRSARRFDARSRSWTVLIVMGLMAAITWVI